MRSRFRTHFAEGASSRPGRSKGAETQLVYCHRVIGDDGEEYHCPQP